MNCLFTTLMGLVMSDRWSYEACFVVGGGWKFMEFMDFMGFRKFVKFGEKLVETEIYHKNFHCVLSKIRSMVG